MPKSDVKPKRPTQPKRAPKRTTSAAAKAASHGNGKANANGGGSGPRKLPVIAAPAGKAKQIPCLSCGLCCGYVAVEVEAPDTVSRATQMLWYLYHQNVSLYFDGDEWMVQFETRCQHLQDDKKCAIYETRPMICREYDETECEVNTAEAGVSFYNSGEFLGWLEQHHKRVYALVRKNYMPPAHTLDGRMVSRTRLGPFGPRFDALRASRLPQ
jgi:Fe-S-cluster containining protein